MSKGNSTASNEGFVLERPHVWLTTASENWAIQFFGYYRGNRVNLQGSQGGFGTYSPGSEKSLTRRRPASGLQRKTSLPPKCQNQRVKPTHNDWSAKREYDAHDERPGYVQLPDRKDGLWSTATSAQKKIR